MKKDELRKAKRFEEMVKVTVPHLSQFSGVLVDVSKMGCKIHFNLFLNIEMGTEYEIIIYPVLAGVSSFSLVGEPVWIQNTRQSTEIGFQFLRTTGIKAFEAYIDGLAAKEEKSLAENSFY